MLSRNPDKFANKLVVPLWMPLSLDFVQIDVLGDVYWGRMKEILIPVFVSLLL